MVNYKRREGAIAHDHHRDVARRRHQLADHDVVVVLRFGSAEEHANIKNAVRASGDYTEELCRRAGHDGTGIPLVLSCFAVTDSWTPDRLAEDTNYRVYRTAAASTLLDAGYELWPTNVFADGVPDPRNEVHYDLLVAMATPEQVTATLSGSDKERRAGRGALEEPFTRLFALLDEHQLSADTGSFGTVD